MNNETKICNVCNESIKKKNVNKHNRSRRPFGLSSLVVNRFTDKNPDNKLKKYRNVYDRKFESYSINCYSNIVLVKNQIFNVVLKRMISLVRPTFIRQKVLKKI